MAEKRKTRELEAAFREAGIPQADALADHVRVRLADAELLVRPVSAGHGHPYEVRNALAHAGGDVVQAHVAATFVAGQFTTGAIDLLREAGANYLDDRRFVFRNDEPFVAINLERTTRENRRPTREPGLGGKIGIAVQEMLLADVEWWGVIELAETANVAAGTAQNALGRLEAMGLLDVMGTGPNKRRRLRDKGAVLDQWVRYARAEREVLFTSFVMSQGPADRALQVTNRLIHHRIDHAVTGGCAGLLLAPHVTDVRTCEVWVDPALGTGMIANALGHDPLPMGGNVIVLQTRSDSPLYGSREVQGAMVANPLRVYADLLDDPRRGEEHATFLRETVLGF